MTLRVYGMVERHDIITIQLVAAKAIVVVDMFVI